MNRAIQAEARVIPLTRQSVETILAGHMGWEDIDVKSFWSVARKLQREGKL